MTKTELNNAVETAKAETRNALQTVYLYGVEYDE